MANIQILVVEDEPLIAEDISEYLSNVDYAVAAIAYNKAQALLALEKQIPDLVLLDINLGGNVDGLDLAQLINQKYHTPFIFLTSYAHKSILDQAKLTRPMGYILKPFNERDLYSSIEIALYNFAQNAQPRNFSLEKLNQQLLSPLTEKEFQVLQDIYQGCTNKQMAEQHFVSVNTIKTHLQNLYDKLNVCSRSEAIVKLREMTF
ncbi:MAG TPA: response regulator [Haliscomenobacter sp.]|uniref:response regulator n=1 Tax=Haliscomenobacter sp. TaxID=2717303 RepID=UPI002CC6EA86|nr:response regulator [Haliscomenobacter sp.]HOY19732.1 response regulator [Haliscomenobacter sp.]HPH21367.1 response regulator [Haliscomenobacter sp.]